MLRILPPLLCATLLCVGCSFRLLERNPFSDEISIEREMEMTAEIHRSIRAQAELVTDPLLLAYVNDLGQQIVAVTEPQPFIYRFSILEGDELNAFTIGGGYVYISSAVLGQAGNITELVGVLAHEVAHVRKRHIARSQENQGLVNLATLAAMAAVVLAGADPTLLAIPQGINVSMQLQNSREHEAEADREGLQYMVRAGYDPEGMARFFERILTEHPHAGEGIPAYLFTHPAVRERIVATRVDIKRMDLPDDLVETDDGLLEEMQGRLALAEASLAGGSGLQARARFDRKLSDPFLAEARRQREAGHADLADQALARGQEVEPQDPRLALARADLAEERGDFAAARIQLERAYEIDPTVPLVQYRLGSVHKQLGSRSLALFYLEQAATNFNLQSSGRRKAELAIDQLSFQILEESGIGGHSEEDRRRVFKRGEPVTWWGRLSRRFQTYNPKLEVEWTDPNGEIVLKDSLQMSPLGRVSSDLRTDDAALGQWTVRVRLADSLVEEREFELIDAIQSGSKAR